MLNFLNKYRLIFFVVFPMLTVAGMGARILAIPIAAIAAGIFYQLRRIDHILLMFMIVLILGDTRTWWLGWAKPLRIELVMIITLMIIQDFREGKYSFNKKFTWFLPFLIISTASLMFSPEISTGLLKMISYTLVVFIAFHLIKEYMHDHFDEFLEDLAMLSILVLTVGLLLMFVNPGMVFFGSRYRGLMGNPNGLGVYLTVTTPIILYYFEKLHKPKRGLRNYAYAVILLSAGLSASRTAMMAVALFLLARFAFRGDIYRRILILGGVIPMLVIVIFNLPLADIVEGLGLGSYFRTEELATASGRSFAWDFALQHIGENPLFGGGFANDEYVFRHKEESYILSYLGHQGGVHNTYLSLLLNVGVVGLGALIMFWVGIFRHIRNKDILIPYLISVLFSATFESYLNASLNAFFIHFLIMIMFLLEESESTKFIYDSR